MPIWRAVLNQGGELAMPDWRNQPLIPIKPMTRMILIGFRTVDP
jgi:hypothetical protein